MSVMERTIVPEEHVLKERFNNFSEFSLPRWTQRPLAPLPHSVYALVFDAPKHSSTPTVLRTRPQGLPFENVLQVLSHLILPATLGTIVIISTSLSPFNRNNSVLSKS